MNKDTQTQTADTTDETTTETDGVKTRGRPRGFAAMDPDKVREIASKGGKAAHAAGTAHTFSSDEARRAGTKGGNAPHRVRGKGPGNKTKTDGKI